MSVRIAPSVLSADFGRLADDVARCEAGGADWIHVDVMDGRFVPNLTFGAKVIETLRRVTKLPLDVHLMVVEPEKYFDSFAGAGADVLTIHQEAAPHLHRQLNRLVHIFFGTDTHGATGTCDQFDLLGQRSAQAGSGNGAFVAAAHVHDAYLRWQRQRADSLQPMTCGIHGDSTRLLVRPCSYLCGRPNGMRMLVDDLFARGNSTVVRKLLRVQPIDPCVHAGFAPR